MEQLIEILIPAVFFMAITLFTLINLIEAR